MSKQVEFFFDVGSPTTYLAWTQLPALCAQAGAELVYRPMLLGGVFQATGNASPANVPAKARYMDADMARFARRYGVPLNLNDPATAAKALAMAGFDPAEVMGWANDAEVKAALRATTEEAVARG